MSLAVEASIAMFLLAALFPLRDAPYLREVDPHVTHAMMRVALSLHAHGFGLALAFFGCWCVIVGVMIARSRLVPRPIGLLMQLAGGCYLTNSFALIVAPALADRLFPFVLLPCFVAEAAFALWLTLRGIDESRFVALAERGARTGRRA